MPDTQPTINLALIIAALLINRAIRCLAIGKEGQNARLAAKLTGWKIDIKSETQVAELMREQGINMDDIAMEEPQSDTEYQEFSSYLPSENMDV